MPELSLLLEAAPVDADYPELRRLAVEQNALLKRTAANRRGTFKVLAQLYGLRQDMTLYRAFRTLWADAGVERPLLALLLATARDVGLRATAPVVLGTPYGQRVQATDFEEGLIETFGERYSAATRMTMAEHLGGSWVQSGHLAGQSIKRRAQAKAGPATAAFALLLGDLTGAAGILLFDTFWTRLLDLSPAELDAQAFVASQREWLTYRRIGDVVDISFAPALLGETGRKVGA